jgi:hypothetical protein
LNAKTKNITILQKILELILKSGRKYGDTSVTNPLQNSKERKQFKKFKQRHYSRGSQP